MRNELKQQLAESKEIYYMRVAGDKELWSSSTKCMDCGDWWMWGVKDNLSFLCTKCENVRKEDKQLVKAE